MLFRVAVVDPTCLNKNPVSDCMDISAIMPSKLASAKLVSHQIDFSQCD